MAVASKSAVSAHKRQVPSKARAVAELNLGVISSSLKVKDLPSSSKSNGKTVPILSSSRSTPLWLLRLAILQRRFSMMTFLLVTAMLTLYSWTVYSQKTWNQAYNKLETLQRNERQLTTTSEVLKNQMAQQAEQPSAGLMPPNPAKTIFMPPAVQRPARTPESVIPATKANRQTEQLPLGY